jgi:pantetheine-phosphate adenylyltransferase
MSRALYPGSFDPFHLGHLDVVDQAAALFGEVVVAVMHNPEKPMGAFTTEQRIAMAQLAVADRPNVSVSAFPGLAIDAAQSAHATCIVKGLRSPSDFEIEQQMAHTNFAVSGVRTIYVPCKPEYGFISSRFIREIAQYGGDTSSMLPPTVMSVMDEVFPKRGQK